MSCHSAMPRLGRCSTVAKRHQVAIHNHPRAAVNSSFFLFPSFLHCLFLSHPIKSSPFTLQNHLCSMNRSNIIACSLIPSLIFRFSLSTCSSASFCLFTSLAVVLT